MKLGYITILCHFSVGFMLESVTFYFIKFNTKDIFINPYIRKCHFSAIFMLENVTFRNKTGTQYYALSLFNGFYVRKCHFSFYKTILFSNVNDYQSWIYNSILSLFTILHIKKCHFKI